MRATTVKADIIHTARNRLLPVLPELIFLLHVLNWRHVNVDFQSPSH